MLLIAVVGTSVARAESPLERLRNRDATRRWQKIRPKFDFSAGDSNWRTLDDDTAAAPPRPVPTPAPAPRTISESDAVPNSEPVAQPPRERPRPLASNGIRPRPTNQRATKPRAFDGVVSRPIPLPSPVSEETFQPFEEPEDVVAPAEAVVVQEAPAESEPEPIRPIPEPAKPPVPLPDYEAGPEGFRLSRIQDIQPFADYEPDADLRESDPCGNLCPRPEDCPPGFASQCPEEYELPLVDADIRPTTDIGFEWEASNLYSNPLYFDDPKLERYGHTHHHLVQPFASAGRFGVQLIAIPYKATIDPYCKKMYALGFYRPGDHAPQQYEPIPFNRDAALVQGGVTTGAFFLFP